jgi:CubicO group peptidase (beta-lactamase class C family)
MYADAGHPVTTESRAAKQPLGSGSRASTMKVFWRHLPAILLALFVAAVLTDCGGGGSGTVSAPTAAVLPAPAAMIARAKALELNTPYVPPPGDPLEHDTSGYAKAMCSAVFITGMDIDVAAENVGYFTAPYASRAKVGRPVVDRVKQQVSVSMPGGPTLVARYFGSQGCITLPPDHDDVFFTPVPVASALPDPGTQTWPMGDVLPTGPLSGNVDLLKLDQAAAAAFLPAEAYTQAFVVTYKGRLVVERYMSGVGPTTRLESWSMGKSVVASMMGVLIQQGVYQLDQPAPIPEWQSAGDPRQQIRIADLMHMSSGLRIKAPDDPDFDPNGTYPDHLYFYTGHIDAFNYAATRPQQWPPNAVGRYRNTDPVLASYLIRLAVEKRGEDYLSFPQRDLFDKIGIRTMVMETDPYGNFLSQGYDFMSARDWARLGNLYLQDGVWNGERILPEGFVKFVSTVAPAWAADVNPIYGGFFWLNTTSTFPLPPTAFFMLGAGGQYVFIDPVHDLVVVRMGYSKGEPYTYAGLYPALQLLMQAIPPSQ